MVETYRKRFKALAPFTEDALHARPDEGGRLELTYRSRSKSSAVRFACLRMDLKVPFASSRCIGTMTINTCSARRLFSLT